MVAVPLQRAGLLATAAAATALAGCGEEAHEARVPSGAIAFEQRDYRFRPQAVRAESGRVRITVANRGRLPHALQLRLKGRERLRIRTVLPGRRGSAGAELPPGRYRFACPIANHEELGMHGVLTLR